MPHNCMIKIAAVGLILTAVHSDLLKLMSASLECSPLRGVYSVPGGGTQRNSPKPEDDFSEM